MQYVAITGHRPSKLDNDYDLTKPLTIEIREQILAFMYKNFVKHNVTYITGLALGIDTLFAQMAIVSNIPFIAAIPCLNQSIMWKNKSKKLYADILAHPLCTIQLVSNTEYNSEVMQKRNEWMVDHCNTLIAVWDGTSGGTANCVKYAKEQLYAGDGMISSIHYINPHQVRSKLQSKTIIT